MSEPNQFFEGQIYERGAWIPTQLHAPNAAKQIAKHFGELEKKHRLRFSKLSVEVLKGDHGRAPKPQQQPFFVVVWAAVAKVDTVETIDVAWVNDLRLGDMLRLREATKRALKRNNIEANDSEADLVIGVLGPKLARRMLEEKIHGQLVDGKLLKAANDARIGD